MQEKYIVTVFTKSDGFSAWTYGPFPTDEAAQSFVEGGQGFGLNIPGREVIIRCLLPVKPKTKLVDKVVKTQVEETTWVRA